MSEPILEVEHLTKDFSVKSAKGLRVVRRTVQAVTDVRDRKSTRLNSSH